MGPHDWEKQTVRSLMESLLDWGTWGEAPCDLEQGSNRRISWKHPQAWVHNIRGGRRMGMGRKELERGDPVVVAARELLQTAIAWLRADRGWLMARSGWLAPTEVVLAGERPETPSPPSNIRRLPIEDAGVEIGELGLIWDQEPPVSSLETPACRAIERMAAALLQLAREQQASRRLLHVQEQELCRIVLDIHDGPVQEIFAALSQIQILLRTGRLGRTARRRLEQAAQLLERSLTEIRTFIGAFRPPEFESRPLLAMVHGLILQHEVLTGHEVHLEVEGALPTPSLPVKIALYRLLQEALNNAARYAGVAHYIVRLRGEPSGLWLEVRDEGRGFDPELYLKDASPEAMRHFGLRGMRDRAALLGGRFEIESAPGRGTSIRVWLPC